MFKTKTTNKIIISVIIFIILILALIYLRADIFIKEITAGKDSMFKILMSFLPSEEDFILSQRINVLILGIGGPSHESGLLSDSMMVASLNPETNKLVIFSIPRDLYVPIEDFDKTGKINSAYALGEIKKRGGGLEVAKNTVAKITGLPIHYGITINFDAFKDLINELDGIKIQRQTPFIEDKQWGCDEEGKNCQIFYLPEGENILDGEKALFYVRSRFSSSDFDREKRQQEVMRAIKDKIISSDFLTSPIKLNRLLNLLSSNIKTDVTFIEANRLMKYIYNIKNEEVLYKVFDVSEKSVFYATRLGGSYVILPKDQSFKEFKNEIRLLLKNN